MARCLRPRAGIARGIAAISLCVLLVPLLASARPSAQPDGVWSGTWKTEWGTLRLIQRGDQVTGTYSPGKGKIGDVKVKGLELFGDWSDVPTYRPPRDAGVFQLRLDSDGKSFSGRWSYGSSGDWNKGWNGRRLSAPPAAPRKLDVILFQKRYQPPVAYAAHCAAIRICNRDAHIHRPFTLDQFNKLGVVGKGGRFTGILLREGACLTMKALNPTEGLYVLKLYDDLHSQERMEIVITPAKLGRSPPTTSDPITWTLKTTSINPKNELPDQGSSIVPTVGHLRWQILNPPQVEFTVDYPRPPARLTPGARHTFPVQVAGRIIGGTDTNGHRQIAPILYVNDRWVGNGPSLWQSCTDPAGSAPISCTPAAQDEGAMTFTVPVPTRRGATFSYGVGALNCGPCYVRFQYVAK